MKILHVCANPKPTDESISKQLAAAFFMKLVSLNPNIEMDNVDLDADPPPRYSYEQFRGCWYPTETKGYIPTSEEEEASKYAREMAARFNNSDVLVLTMPMWNYSMPAAMKGWIDHVLSPGLVYEKRTDSVRTLHNIKRLILIVASGDVFKEGDPRDALTPVVENAFKTVGIEDISLAWADGQDRNRFTDSDQRKEMAKEAVEEHAEEVAETEGATG